MLLVSYLTVALRRNNKALVKENLHTRKMKSVGRKRPEVGGRIEENVVNIKPLCR